MMEETTKTKGVVMIGCGHHNYGKMAAALAATIRLQHADLPILLFTAGNALFDLDEQEKALFSSITEIPESCYKVESKTNWLRTKLFMYELSPFDQTIYLDVDMVMFPNKSLEKYFETLRGTELQFSIYNKNSITDLTTDKQPTHWFKNVAEFKTAYGFESGTYYNICSEFVYFEKSEKVKAIFDSALEVFDHPKIETLVFAGTIPDEFAFSVAMIQHEYKLPIEQFAPAYWEMEKQNVSSEWDYIRANYLFYTIRSYMSNEITRERYSRLARAAYYNLKMVKMPYAVTHKRNFLIERQNA